MGVVLETPRVQLTKQVRRFSLTYIALLKGSGDLITKMHLRGWNAFYCTTECHPILQRSRHIKFSCSSVSSKYWSWCLTYLKHTCPNTLVSHSRDSTGSSNLNKEANNGHCEIYCSREDTWPWSRTIFPSESYNFFQIVVPGVTCAFYQRLMIIH